MNRFDLEQQIIRCWMVTDDIKELSEFFLNFHPSNLTQDKVANALTGVQELYDIKFKKLWDGFDEVVMAQEKKIKMLEEECAAMREQMGFAADGQGYGIEAIKPKKKK